MGKFNVHKWNADRREAALNEGNPSKWSVIYTSPKGVDSTYYYSSEEEARKILVKDGGINLSKEKC